MLQYYTWPVGGKICLIVYNDATPLLFCEVKTLTIFFSFEKPPRVGVMLLSDSVTQVRILQDPGQGYLQLLLVPTTTQNPYVKNSQMANGHSQSQFYAICAEASKARCKPSNIRYPGMLESKGLRDPRCSFNLIILPPFRPYFPWATLHSCSNN